MATVSQGTIYGLSCTCHPDAGIRYVGQTAVKISERLTGHRSSARFGIKTPVYYWMRKHGVENIRITFIETPGPGETLDECEIRLIRDMRKTCNLLNLSDGGEGRRGYFSPSQSLAMRGSNHFATSLTDDDVRYIRSEYGGERGQVTKFARQFGMNPTSIVDILSGKTWGHIPLGSVVPPKRPRRITETDVRTIRQKVREGESQRELAIDYRVTLANISMIVNRKTWKHVT
jgi:hypothetical protein